MAGLQYRVELAEAHFQDCLNGAINLLFTKNPSVETIAKIMKRLRIALHELVYNEKRFLKYLDKQCTHL